MNLSKETGPRSSPWTPAQITTVSLCSHWVVRYTARRCQTGHAAVRRQWNDITTGIGLRGCTRPVGGRGYGGGLLRMNGSKRLPYAGRHGWYVAGPTGANAGVSRSALSAQCSYSRGYKGTTLAPET
jgi:hypothetical protein